MFIFLLQRAVAAIAESFRLTHCAHAAFTIGHDLPVIIHGSVPVSSVFAAWVLGDTASHFAKRVCRAWQARRAQRAREAAEVAAPVAAEG